jgi:hypothetical protein
MLVLMAPGWVVVKRFAYIPAELHRYTLEHSLTVVNLERKEERTAIL